MSSVVETPPPEAAPETGTCASRSPVYKGFLARNATLSLFLISLEAGASDYLAKPVNTEQLLSALRSWLHR
jgi:CheY-like chemotaxis protein